MKTFTRIFAGICAPFVFCLPLFAQADIPEYSSTFNEGMGKQQRLNAIEDQLIVLTNSQKEDQKKLYEQMPSQKEFEQMSKDLKSSQAEVKELEGQVQQLRNQNLELARKLKQVDGTELRELVEFVRPLKEGDLDKMKQEIEGLKLTIRSMSATIESMQHKDSSSP